jgi:hypothetical protein
MPGRDKTRLHVCSRQLRVVTLQGLGEQVKASTRAFDAWSWLVTGLAGIEER